MSTFGAGSLAAGMILVVLGGSSERRIIISGGTLALILILLGISRVYPVSLRLMALAGLSGTVFGPRWVALTPHGLACRRRA